MRIAQATAKGKLGMFAKVPRDKGATAYFISVYNNNFNNKEGVKELEEKIRHLGVKGKMVYKPSVFTVLRIFAINDWSLNVGTYTSCWNSAEDRSVIKDETM